MKFLIVALLRFYKYFISPLLGPRCRFIPTCSEYALECFHKFPIYKALWYSSKRLCKCHPFHPGGYDPVPDKRGKND